MKTGCEGDLLPVMDACKCKKTTQLLLIGISEGLNVLILYDSACVCVWRGGGCGCGCVDVWVSGCVEGVETYREIRFTLVEQK